MFGKIKIAVVTFLLAATANAAYLNQIQGQLPEGSAASGSQPVVMGGKDGSGNSKVPAVNSDGSLLIPTGAATSANQSTANASLSSIDGKLTAPLSTSRTWSLLNSSDSVTAYQGGTWNIGITSSVLPTGAATSALQTTGNTSLGNIDTATSSINTKTPSLVSGRVPVDGSGVTQPVSASSLPLPTGAATEATLSALSTKTTDGTQKTKIVNAAGDTMSSLDDGAGAKSLGVALMATNFTFSPSNFGPSALTSNQNVVGSCESAVPQQAISVLASSDVAGTFYLGQYIDAACTNGKEIAYPVQAGATNALVRSFVANGNYVKFRFVNGPTASTASYANIAFGTLQMSTNAGNQPSSIEEVGGTVISTSLPTQATPAVPTRVVPAKKFRTTFAKVRSSVDSAFFTTVGTGSGMAVSQSAGNLVITSGTTANSETILRSTDTFSDAMITRYKTILSQRIAQNNFFIEMVDLIGDGLSMTINSTTSVTITYPSNTANCAANALNPTNLATQLPCFDSESVGQSMNIGIPSVASTVPGRYAIASVSGNNITFTVAGWPASGSGTASLFGWNYCQVLYDSTTATNAKYDCQRRGWNSGATTATINTSASPGHMGIMTIEDGIASYLDQLVASSTTIQSTMRASRVENIPDQFSTMYLQIRALNGTSAPASTTTWTIGMAHVENYTSQPVTINQTKAQAFAAAQPVNVTNTVTVSATNLSTNLAQVNGNTTVTAGANGVLAVGGNIANSTAATTNPVQSGGRVVTTLDTTLAQGDASYQNFTTAGQLVVKSFGSRENDWVSAAASGGISNTTTAVTLKAAGAASIRNCLTSIDIQHNTLGGATELAIRDGAAGTVVWRTELQTTEMKAATISFPTPICGTAATLMEVVTLTAVTGKVYVNAHGYQAF